MTTTADADTSTATEATEQPAAAGLKPQYPNVEAWVRDYLLHGVVGDQREASSAGRAGQREVPGSRPV